MEMFDRKFCNKYYIKDVVFSIENTFVTVIKIIFEDGEMLIQTLSNKDIYNLEEFVMEILRERDKEYREKKLNRIKRLIHGIHST